MTAGPPPGGGHSGPPRRRSARAVICGTATAASVGLALLVFGATAIAMVIPRASLGQRTEALHRTLAGEPATITAVFGNLDYPTFDTGFNAQPFTAAQLGSVRAGLAAAVIRDGLPGARAATRPGAAAPDWVGLTSGYAVVTGEARQAFTGFPPQMEILYRDQLPHYSRLDAGHLPEQGRASPGHVVLQIAVTPATAARFGLRPGSRLGFGGDVILDVTGIVTPVQPESAFWGADAIAAAPQLAVMPLRVEWWDGAAFISPAEVPLLQAGVPTARMQVSWAVPLSVAHLPAGQVTALESRLSGAVVAGALVHGSAGVLFQGSGAPIQVPLSSGLLAVLTAFSGEDQALGTVLGLVFVSLAAIGVVAVVLGAGLVAARRRAEFAVMRARGASLAQIAGRALIGSAALTLPAAAAGGALAVAVTPGGGTAIAWWLAGSTVIVALAGLPLLAAAGQRGGTRRARSAASRRAAVARRVVAEAGLAGAAVGGIIVLREQGLSSGHVDVYSSAAPVLVAAVAAIVVAHVYPLVLRAALRLARVRPGVSALVGLAQATRASAVGVAAVFALILALAVVAFGTMVGDAVHQAEVSQSWREVGADAIVNASSSSRPLSPAVQREIAAVPGTERTAAALVTPGSLGSGSRITVVLLNPAGYAALAARAPGPAFPAAALARRPGSPGGAVPVLASSAAAVSVPPGGATLRVAGHRIAIRLAGQARAVPGAWGGSFLILPDGALAGRQPPPSVMLVAGPDLDAARLAATVRRALPGASLSLRGDVLSGLAGAPLPHAAQAGIAEGAAAAAGFSALILLITLLMTGQSRELTLARLATMGLRPAQARWLVTLELLPQVLAAAAGGVASAWALTPLIAPSISLSAFTGSGASAAITPEPVPLAASAAGLIVLSAAALAAQFLIARHRGVTGALRAGE